MAWLGLAWIYLRTLLLLEHLAVLKSGQIIQIEKLGSFEFLLPFLVSCALDGVGITENWCVDTGKAIFCALIDNFDDTQLCAGQCLLP